MRYVSLFSGIEAASAAWEPLGWTPLAFAEVEPFPSAVLAHHYPHVPNLGDVTKVDWHEFRKTNGHVDLVVFGSPCQSFSVAGKRLGLDDPRGNLALFALGVVDALRPDWFVFENVPGLLSSGDGRDFGSFLGTVGELGYGWSYRILDAQFTRAPGFPRAVPQRRRRVFVVGNSRSWTRAAAVLFEPESLSWNSAPRREAGERVAPTISSRPTGGGGLGTDFDCDGGLIANAVAPTLNAAFGQKLWLENQHIDSGAGMFVAHIAKAIAIQAGALRENPASGPDGIGVQADTAYTLEARQEVQAVAFAQNQRDEIRQMDVAGAIAAEPGMKQQTFVAFNITPSNSNKDFNAREASYAQAVTTQGGAPSARGGDIILEAQHATISDCAAQVSGVREGRGAIHPGADGILGVQDARGRLREDVSRRTWAVRRLTPRECERLQGFPDDYTLIEVRGKPAADGPRYKALGNSMAVNVMSWLGHRIDLVQSIVNSSKRDAA